MLANSTPAAIIIAASLLSFWIFTPNFIIWLLIAEIFWIGLFLFFAVTCAHLDSLTLAVWSLFILCLATSESATGLSLLIFNFMRTGNIHGAPDQKEKNK